MIVVRDFDRLKGKELVATIGFFDGVHLGHRFLIDEMKEIAKARSLSDNLCRRLRTCSTCRSRSSIRRILKADFYKE